MKDTKKMLMDVLNENYKDNSSRYMRLSDIRKYMNASEKEIEEALGLLEKSGDVETVLDARTGEETVKANYSCLMRGTNHLYDMPYYL